VVRSQVESPYYNTVKSVQIKNESLGTNHEIINVVSIMSNNTTSNVYACIYESSVKRRQTYQHVLLTSQFYFWETIWAIFHNIHETRRNISSTAWHSITLSSQLDNFLVYVRFSSIRISVSVALIHFPSHLFSFIRYNIQITRCVSKLFSFHRCSISHHP